jgi:hypothetical protein
LEKLNTYNLGEEKKFDNKINKKSFAYFLLTSDISNKINEQTKIFIIKYYLKDRERLRNHIIFDVLIECLTQMKNNLETISENNLFDIYFPEEYIIFI